MRVIAGIEITAVEDGDDVHVLGYFIDPDSAILAGFLREQRDDRIRRVREMGERLRSLGMPVDVDALIATAASRQRAASAGRRLRTRSWLPGRRSIGPTPSPGCSAAADRLSSRAAACRRRP